MLFQILHDICIYQIIVVNLRWKYKLRRLWQRKESILLGCKPQRHHRGRYDLCRYVRPHLQYGKEIYKYVFLSRLRFGKSLLSSTLHSYLKEGKSFSKGLAIETLEKEWIEYPVLHFDLSTFKNCDLSLPEKFDMQLRRFEKAIRNRRYEEKCR